jgi:flavin reductase (DIM6/NTAB) family NADH-FMN oxidoreductase RutF
VSAAAEHPGSAPAEADFRRAVGRFATGVCVLTSRLDGHDHAMTANAFASVSLDPLLVLVSVWEDARFLDAELQSQVWGVSILPESGKGTADWLSSPGRPVLHQLDRVPHHRGPVTGVALLDDALATLECRTDAVHPAGDHSIVVGAVVAVEAPQEVPPPLVHHQGRYRRLV